MGRERGSSAGSIRDDAIIEESELKSEGLSGSSLRTIAIASVISGVITFAENIQDDEDNLSEFDLIVIPAGPAGRIV